jgi:hypothetical protein
MPHALAPPRHWTPRDPTRRTDATYGEAVAAMMGRPWAPPQRFIAEVAGELLASGHYAYTVIVVTMPRQCGKSTTSYDVALGRGRAYRDYRCKYSTHKGTITSDRYADWFLELERNPRVMADMRLRRSRGTEAIGWRRTGSYFQAFPARDGALRSAALDLVVVDEAQEHDELLGEALRRTITPTFSTRPRRQLWIVFTAGTDASTYAREYYDRAVAGEPGYAIFDYGCPDDVDPLDRDLWHTWHPGLAYGLTDHDALDMALSEGAAAFVREYGNRWTRTAAGRVISEDDWRAVQHTDAMPPGPLCLSIDVAFEADHAAVALAGPGRHLEIVDVLPVQDATERVFELQGRYGAPIAVDKYGPTALVHDELATAGADLVDMTSYDVAVAAAGFRRGVGARDVSIWPHPALDEAVAVAGTRPLGDGFKWSRRGSAGSIAPLVAATNALWGIEHMPPAKRAPVATTS